MISLNTVSLIESCLFNIHQTCMDTIGGQELLLSGKQVSSSLCYFVYENLTKRTVFENLVSAQPFRASISLFQG